MEQYFYLIEITIGLISLISAIAYISSRFTKLETKLNLVWDFLMERGMVEVVHHGLGIYSSPLAITEKAPSLFPEALSKDLKSLYTSLGRITERDLSIKIEEIYGDRLVQEVCIPHKIMTEACLLLATKIAMSHETIP